MIRLRTLRLGSRGTDVMEIQSLLSRIGYNPGPVDGIFGLQIQQAVIPFQRDNILTPDGVIGPAPTRYGGSYPESETESRAVANFTRQHNFRLAMAYHSQGEVIFWNYENLAPPVARRIGELFAQVSGYLLADPVGIASYAGYKDWFIGVYRRPGYTIEVGRGVNPLPIAQFDRIYNDNEEMLLLAAGV